MFNIGKLTIAMTLTLILTLLLLTIVSFRTLIGDNVDISLIPHVYNFFQAKIPDSKYVIFAACSF